MALIARSILLVLLLCCSGCITDQFAASPSTTTQGEGTLTISRSDDLTYGSAAASVELNGKQIATLAMGRTFTGSVPAGAAVLKVSAWTVTLGIAAHRLPQGSTTYRFNIEAGKSYSFVVSPRVEQPPTAEAPSKNNVNAEAADGGGGAFVIAVNNS